MTGERKKLLIVGFSKNQGHRCIEQAKRRDLHISILETKQFFTNNREVTKGADILLPMPGKTIPEIQTWLASANLANDFSYIFTFDELSVEATALIAKHLGLAANTPEAIATVKDKYKLRRALAKAGLEQPPIQKCSTIEEARSFFKQEMNGNAAIIKPRIGLGSEGVSLVRNENDILPAYQNLSEHDKTDFLIEGFVKGAEYSVEGVFVEKQPIFFGITEKQLLNGTFIECGHIFPAPLIAATTRKILDAAKKALHATGLTHGLFHMELWVTEAGVVLGEIHARPGGGFIHWLSELSTGIETYGSAIDDLMGKNALDKAFFNRKIFGIRYLQVKPGKVTNIASVSDIKTMASCIYLHCPLVVGEIVKPIQNWREREKIGYIIATGKSYDDFNLNIAEIQNALAIKTIPI
ncbi:ATP-grasp domain-containing protein [Bartonella sp. TP]|uniref:ATP-grasp domain-containing protein n=1 Tax=Bartonella sp. TP TaxID=3057550 RepID=UPI0025B25C73|nr:ATP-grasp domain-containing protein [Bartonella sp. TP]WJW79991.1 ATP-grasp domain-containing protein [Bartonella sp. TP]